MQQAKLSDIIGIINKIAPQSLAEDWDNPGLQLGDPGAAIDRIMVALDPLPETIDAAIQSSCQLLVTHHPLIFKPLKRITTADQPGSLIYRAIRNGLAVVSAHTNYDVAENGVNDLLAGALGLVESRPLKVTRVDELLKLVVFVPQSHEEQLLEALLRFGGLFGNYGECSFRSGGVGTFKPQAGARPFLGRVGTRESVAESRIELLVRRADQAAAVKALLAAHPYEEPAFDLIPLLNDGPRRGLGRIGELPAPVPVEEFAALVKERLGVSSLRLVGRKAGVVARIAICGGSGVSLLKDAVRQGADLFITGDMKYHDAREVETAGITVIDAGHFATERLMVEGLTLQLQQELEQRRLTATVVPCRVEQDPFVFV